MLITMAKQIFVDGMITRIKLLRLIEQLPAEIQPLFL